MVIEFLTFEIDPSEMSEWLAAEEQHWSRFLERQDGFVRKQMWRPVDETAVVHAVIWWESLDKWKAIPQAELEAVAEAMGPLERSPSMQRFDVVREC